MKRSEVLMILGRLLGLTAILLQFAVLLQPLLPEKHSIFSVCKTVAATLHLEVNSAHQVHTFPISQSHVNNAGKADQKNVHSFSHVEDKHEHSQHDNSHNSHDCLFCLVHSYTLPLLDTKLRQVLVRTQTLLLFFTKTTKHNLFKTAYWFLIPQGRAPPITQIY